jgi:uncharacterized protein (UPF0332 family)
MLVESGFPRQATSRAYYAAFSAARAVLEVAVVSSPKTHSGLPVRFSEFAHATPAIGGDVGRALSQVEIGRLDADNGEPTIGVDQANDAIAKAEHVVAVVKRAIAGGLGSGS